jgi:MFS family permease
MLVALCVLSAPALTLRNDLKQYTADACIALVVINGVAWVERRWSRRRLAVMGVVVVVGMLFSDAAAFVGAAAFAGLVAGQLLRRAWRQGLESAAAAIVTAAGMLAVYESFYARAVVPGLTAYWQGSYLPVGNGAGASWHYLYVHAAALRSTFGLGPWWIAIPLVVAGLFTLARIGHLALSLTFLALVAEMVVLSAAKRYPLLDERTSTFLIVIAVVVAAVGALGVASLLWRRTVVGATGVGLILAALFVAHGSGDFRAHTIPPEDVRSPAAYVASHLQAADVVLVNLNSNWGFAYYWTRDRPIRRPDPAVLQSYVAAYPPQGRIVVATGRDITGVRAALDLAVRIAAQHPGSRIWLVRTHVIASEAQAWAAVLAARHLVPVPVLGFSLEWITVP